ncbi:MAG: hypothetical protein U0X41_03300 [Chitinophagales bacterium]
MRISEADNEANIALKKEFRERGFYVRVVGSDKEEIEYLIVSAVKGMPTFSHHDIVPWLDLGTRGTPPPDYQAISS